MKLKLFKEHNIENYIGVITQKC